MKVLDALMKRAAQADRRIALSEGSDPRVISAAIKAHQGGIARITLVGNADEISGKLRAGGVQPDAVAEICDPEKSALFDELAALHYSLQKRRNMTVEEARGQLSNPHIFSALLVRAGYADGTVGGCVAPTPEIVRTAIKIIGPAPGNSLISSFFLMQFEEPFHARKGAFIFADCGLVVDPDAEQLATIARMSAISFGKLVKQKPRVAMLSFSTHGSASHPAATKVVDATSLIRAESPDLIVDGELQFDAAFVPGVAAAKAPQSPLGGQANIFIFPNLDSGNIAYKIAQRMAGAVAIGPILQGLGKPANDLSRGCSDNDILHMIAVTAVQASQDQ